MNLDLILKATYSANSLYQVRLVESSVDLIITFLIESPDWPCFWKYA